MTFDDDVTRCSPEALRAQVAEILATGVIRLRRRCALTRDCQDCDFGSETSLPPLEAVPKNPLSDDVG